MATLMTVAVLKKDGRFMAFCPERSAFSSGYTPEEAISDVSMLITHIIHESPEETLTLPFTFDRIDVEWMRTPSISRTGMITFTNGSYYITLSNSLTEEEEEDIIMALLKHRHEAAEHAFFTWDLGG